MKVKGTQIIIGLMVAASAIMLYMDLNRGTEEVSNKTVSSSSRQDSEAPPKKSKADDKWGTERVLRDYEVPPLPAEDPQINVRFIPSGEWTGRDQVEAYFAQAFQIIMQVRRHRLLQSNDDLAIYSLIDEVGRGQRRFPLIMVQGEVARHVNIGYSCVQDNYGVGTYIIDPVLLAVSLYHEFMHDVDCRRQMAERGYSRHEQMEGVTSRLNRCDVEAPAHAAAARMFSVILESGLLSGDIQVGRRGENPIANLFNDWRALSRGHEAFCQHMKNNYQQHGEDMLLDKIP